MTEKKEEGKKEEGKGESEGNESKEDKEALDNEKFLTQLRKTVAGTYEGHTAEKPLNSLIDLDARGMDARIYTNDELMAAIKERRG